MYSKTELRKLFTAVEEARELISSTLTVAQFSALCYIGQNEGCVMKDVEKALQITQPTCSRLLGTLSTATPKGGKGAFDLIYQDVDDIDHRERKIMLTNKGRLILQRITNAASK